MITIYGIQNKINGKYYIGQTISVNRRWGQHKRGRGSKHVSNAIGKYGIENFEFFIIVSGIENQEEADNTEAHYIKEYNALEPNGYNVLATATELTTSKIPDEVQKEIIRLYLNKVPTRVIGEKFGISRGAIDKVLIRHNVERRGQIKPTVPKKSKINKERLIELLNNGYTVEQIAEEFETTKKYIYKYIKNNEISNTTVREYNTKSKRGRHSEKSENVL